jgi:hypothetical protein
MGRIATNSKPEAFAVYCRDGAYLQRVQRVDGRGLRTVFGASPVPMGRSEAARACKAVRALGVGAWLVAA